ncbi:MAG: IPT/TIG domain-containing protein, partial [Cytophagales bacterium]
MKIKLLLFVLCWLLGGHNLRAQWVEKNDGLYGGVINALLIDGGNLYAGTSGGVFRSIDYGLTWEVMNSGLTNLTVYSLAMSGSTLYAGTQSGVFRSVDNGANWVPASTGLAIAYIYSIIVSNGNMYAGTSGNGVYRSTDNGDSWVAATAGMESRTVYSFGVSGNNLYAATQGNGVYRSTNNGASWVAVNTGMTNINVNSLAVSNTNLYVGTLGGGVFRSIDNGLTWAAVNTGLTNTMVRSLAVSGSKLYAGTDGGIFRSTDNGANWVTLNNGLPTTATVYSLVVTSSYLYAGTNSGVYRSSDNGANWVAVNTGLTSTAALSLAVSDNKIYAGTNTHIYRSTDNGDHWTAIKTGLGNVFSLAVNGNNLYAGTGSSGVHRSTDNGDHWMTVNTGLGSTTVYALAVNGTDVYAGTKLGVYRSTDNGVNWVALNSGLPPLTAVYSFTMSNGYLYLVGGTSLYRSSDNGASWVETNIGLKASARCLAVKKNDLYVGTSGGVYRSNDNAASWVAINKGLPINSFVWSLVVNGGNLYAGVFRVTTSGTFSDGVYRSTDNGANWVAVNTGLTNNTPQVYSLVVSDNSLYAGTAGRGIWSRPLSELEADAPVVTSFAPTNGSVDTSVTITGINFSPTPADNLVKFNGTSSVITASTATSITTKVPIGATSGAISVTVAGNIGISTTNFTVNKASQIITFPALSAKTFGEAAFTLFGTSSSGLPLTYSTSNTSVATVSGSIVTIVGAGSTTLTASQAGNSNYNPAADVPQSLTVNKAPQIITFPSLSSKTYGDAPFTLSATSSSGLPLTFASSNTEVATVSGNMVTIIGAGTATITASQGGNNNYDPASSPQSLTVNKASQSVTFTALASKTYGDAPFTLSATSSSGLPLTYACSNAGVATVSGNMVTIIGAGTATITASQAGNNNYNPASSPQSLTVNKASQIITFSALSSKTFGDAPFSLPGTSSSGLPLTYSSSNTGVATVSGTTVTIVGAGSTTITAKQSGNDNYNPAADVGQLLTVNKASQTITFSALSNKTYGDATFTLLGTSSSGLALTYTSSNTTVATVSGNTVTVVGAGTANITAKQAGNNNYNPAADVAQPLIINKANQTISFAPLPTVVVNSPAFPLTATASSSLPIAYSTTSNNITLTNGSVGIVAAGRATITASQSGSSN